MSDKSRRKLLKSIAAGSGAIVAGKSLPESWSKPVVDAVMLPAHAQTSSPANPEYFEVLHADPVNTQGPQQMSVIVDSASGMASVVALNRFGNVRPEIQLNIDGTPDNTFTGDIGTACGGVSYPGASWFIDGYTMGDPTISVTSTGTGAWTATLPLGSGTVAATCTT